MKKFKTTALAASVLGAASILTPFQAATAAGPTWNISGWINEGLTYWDDGTGSDVTQMSDNGTTLGSRINFSGSTPLAGTGLTAGFEVIVEPLSTNTPLIFSNQDTVDTFNGDAIGVLGSSVNVGGAWGKVTLGLQSMPTDNIAVLADPSLTLWSGISPVFRGNGFFVRGAPAGTVWGDFLSCLTAPGLSGVGGIGIDCNGVYRNGIRYDLPAFGPVSVAIGYANDDVFDIAVKYSDTIWGLTANVHGGYAVNADGGVTNGAAVLGGGSDNFQIQAGLMDPGTGLFGTVAYQMEETDTAVVGAGDDTDAWWVKLGVKRNWLGFGDTSIAIDYGMYNDQFGNNNLTAGGAELVAGGITGSEVQRYGIGVDQYFGSNLIIYGKYENLSLDVDGASAALYNSAEDLDTFTLGLTFFF